MLRLSEIKKVVCTKCLRLSNAIKRIYTKDRYKKTISANINNNILKNDKFSNTTPYNFLFTNVGLHKYSYSVSLSYYIARRAYNRQHEDGEEINRISWF